MNVVIAIDSFKGSLSSLEAGESAANGIKKVYLMPLQVIRPLADGGEGTVDALVAGCGGKMTTVSVTGPLGETVSCQYGIVSATKTAIIEMAVAAGITLVPPQKKIRFTPQLMVSVKLLLMQLNAAAGTFDWHWRKRHK